MIQQKRAKTTGYLPTLMVKDDKGEDKLVKDSWFTRILGGNVQNNMCWSTHLEPGNKALFPQCRKLLGQLRHNSGIIPRNSRRNIANSLLLSKMNYLMPLWGSAPETYIRRAQVIQNAAARWVTGLGRGTKIRNLMQSVAWLTIKEQI